MPRGGRREGSGRPFAYKSKTNTIPIRVPEGIAEQVLKITRLLDAGEPIDNVQNQKTLALEAQLREIRSKLSEWESLITPERQEAPRWKNTRKLLTELSLILQEIDNEQPTN